MTGGLLYRDIDCRAVLPEMTKRCELAAFLSTGRGAFDSAWCHDCLIDPL